MLTGLKALQDTHVIEVPGKQVRYADFTLVYGWKVLANEHGDR